MASNPLDELRRKIQKSSLRATALELKFSAPYLSDVVNGNRAVSDRLAEKLGFERIESWRKSAAKGAQS